jgi:hypothetical protein
VGGLAGDLEPHREHALRLHPDPQVRRLAGDREVARVALFDDVVRPPRERLVRLLVRHADEVHAHVRLGGQVADRAHHPREPALHVVGAAADQPVAVDARLELLGAAGDHVEVAVEDDRDALGRADRGGEHRQAVVGLAAHLDVVRLEPSLDEAGRGPRPVELGGVVGDEALGEGAFLHGG